MTEPAWSAVDDFYGSLLLPEDPALEAALTANAAAGLPAIDVSPAQGKMLYLLARAIGARRVLEVGTLGGYSTIWLARAVAPEGRVVTCELDRHHAAVATENIARAGLADTVDVRVGPALDTLDGLQGPFDLAFVDADKARGAEYFAHALRLSRPGGVIVVDNVVRGGRVMDADTDDAAVTGTRRFAEALAAEDRVDATVIQTVGSKGHDGFALAVVR
ncbi:O-methyltransferase [Pseudonocardia sp.]|uniref:O-methyltransferase n=1 Tax=Pseudonocardia sp. TaxID=60912 RepID=UPI00260E7E27|nr:O-methyltransferase [Pseudonocardia sp.]